MSYGPIMVIRHAEKPASEADHGIGPSGEYDEKGLTVRGWCRAGALARFFAPLAPMPTHPNIVRPTTIFAASMEAGNRSKRSYSTVMPLADLLKQELRAQYAHHDVSNLAAAVAVADGAVLVCWEHKAISNFIHILTGGAIVTPAWPENRYDMVYVLQRIEDSWVFSQTPQLLLAGDSDDCFC